MTVPLIAYSHAFNQQAAKEFTALPPPCDRLQPVPGCSALARHDIDYGWTRLRLRCLAGTAPAALCTQASASAVNPDATTIAPAATPAK